MRNPPHDMTSLGAGADTGFLATESRISFQPLEVATTAANILHNARWTAADIREIRKCKFSAISPPSSEIWASSTYLKVDKIRQRLTGLSVIISAKNNDVLK